MDRYSFNFNLKFGSLLLLNLILINLWYNSTSLINISITIENRIKKIK